MFDADAKTDFEPSTLDTGESHRESHQEGYKRKEKEREKGERERPSQLCSGWVRGDRKTMAQATIMTLIVLIKTGSKQNSAITRTASAFSSGHS